MRQGGEAVRPAVLDGAEPQKLEDIAHSRGMRVLVEDGLDKVSRGLTSLEELVRVVGSFHIDPHSKGRAGDRGARASYAHEDSRGAARQSFDVESYDALLHRWLSAKPVQGPAATRSNAGVRGGA